MKDVKLRITLCMVSTWLIEVSPLLFNSRPDTFARERYALSKNRTIARSIDPLVDAQALDFVALVNHFGYPAEEHLVTTIDGYNLRIHRIPGSPSWPKTGKKPVVFFQHGLFVSSDAWILMGPTKDLAYRLADAGYDVWVGNARGNTYSRSHVTLSPDYDSEFWEYSFHEVAVFDMTSVIDYILNETDQQSMIYIGHSMGTTISYVLLSIKPEYNKKIKLVISLAPVAFWHGVHRPFIKFLAKNINSIKNFLLNARIYEVFPFTSPTSKLLKKICKDESIFQPFCLNMIYTISGYNPSQFNSSLLAHLVTYFPSGSSIQTLVHYSQNILSGDFKMYDYGLIQNFAIYKQKQPPSYNLTNIIAPVALFYGKGDALIAPGNPIELSTKLSNVITIEPVPDEKFTHLDFLYSRDINTLLNDRLMKIIAKFF